MSYFSTIVLAYPKTNRILVHRLTHTVQSELSPELRVNYSDCVRLLCVTVLKTVFKSVTTTKSIVAETSRQPPSFKRLRDDNSDGVFLLSAPYSGASQTAGGEGRCREVRKIVI